MEQLNPFAPLKDKDDTTSNPSLQREQKQNLLPSAIVECQALNSEMTLKDKLHTCVKRTRKQKSSKTSEVDSTLSVKGLEPYWDAQCTVNSSKLWLPTKTDCVGSDSILYNGLLSRTLEKSWFSIKLAFPQSANPRFHGDMLLSPTFLPSYTSSHVDCTNLEVTKAKLIRIYPISEQRQLFKQWLGSNRYVFNQTIDYLRSCINFNPSWQEVRNDLLKHLPTWCDVIPFQIKAMAVKEAVEAFWRAKGDPKYRSRKELHQSCYIPRTAVLEKGIYPRISGKGLRYSESLPEIPLDSRLVYQYGEWFLSVPYKVKLAVPENQRRIVALDPGVRIFQTFYSENSAGHIGKGDFGRIHRLCFYLDNLISRLSKAIGKSKREMKRAANRMRKKIKNLVKEIHGKTACFLVKNFDVILIPTFESQQMTGRNGRKLQKKSVRALLTWAHYRFKKHLLNKAIETNKEVIQVCEAYTSQTASWSGEIVKVGGSRVIKSGGITCERDLNGARGVFIRSLVDSPTLMSILH